MSAQGKRYVGYIVTFKYLLNDEQMAQVMGAVRALRLVSNVDPIEVRMSPAEQDAPPLTEREESSLGSLPLEALRIGGR